MPRLSESTLRDLKPTVRRFGYSRALVRPGIVHLGIGAFHRAHQAVYLDDLLSGHPSWGIVGASLRRPDTLDALKPQDSLYTIVVRGAENSEARVIGSVLDIIDATVDGERLLEVMSSPSVRIVSLTVTEKGYCHNPATGRLDQAHPDIVHDLAEPHAPVSAPGFILEALDRRRLAGLPAFTVMSCDNLPNNGKTAQNIVLGLAIARDAALAQWVGRNVAFPSTMVDRIVPATTDEDRAAVLEATGVEDNWPVVTEPFTQWVIEDNFSNGRPPFEQVGAELVLDVTPFEHMKLRMLNGSHSSLAYLGYLAGHQYVSDAIARPEFRSFIHGLMTEEVMPTLDMPGTDLQGYRDKLLDRFRNPALKHRTWQIAMDGSQKLPQRLLGTIADRLRHNQSIERLTLGVAGWMRYVGGEDESGSPIDVRDPLAERFAAIAAEHTDPIARVDALLGITDVFGTELPQSDLFRNTLIGHYMRLESDGAANTVAMVAGEAR